LIQLNGSKVTRDILGSRSSLEKAFALLTAPYYSLMVRKTMGFGDWWLLRITIVTIVIIIVISINEEEIVIRREASKLSPMYVRVFICFKGQIYPH
jgi:hypothetical protein